MTTALMVDDSHFIRTVISDILEKDGFDVGQIISTEVYDVQLIEYLLVVTVLVNALLSSLMIRVVDGGHKVNAYIHFVALTWISAIIGSVTMRLVESLLAV